VKRRGNPVELVETSNPRDCHVVPMRIGTPRNDNIMPHHAALAHFPKITYQRYKKLLAFFHDLKNLWRAEIGEIVKARIEEEIAREFIVWREQNPIEKIMENLDRLNIKVVSVNEEYYPKLLAEITDPPHTLFYRGDLSIKNQPTLAVVGSRRYTDYGKRACEQIIGPLAQQGMIIVSGLALGIDGISHQCTLNNQGKTIAVLGSGIDAYTIYPASHKQLAEKIITAGGAVISEYPPGFKPTKYTFPARNRIIAGLSLGTLVVEAAQISGTLITAQCALDYNREVFAVPHAITSITGVGTNNLIKMGAKLVNSAEDITDALNLVNLKQITANRKILPSSPTEEKILSTLSKEPTHVDLIIKQTKLDSPKINGTLTLMEMKGMVKNVGGMMYILSN